MGSLPFRVPAALTRAKIAKAASVIDKIFLTSNPFVIRPFP